MSIEYKKIQDILEERGIKYPEFGCFTNASSVIKVMQWQPQGVLNFRENSGFWCNESLHEKKAKGFLEQARIKKADIVISPEYSFPWNVVQEVINNRELYPSYGKLWCLGMEGISCEDFLEFLKCNEGMDDRNIIVEDLEEITQNYFFSCLIYLFKAMGKIIVVVQLKTTAAADKWAELESKGLTKGKVIYLFKGLNSEFYLYSYICADALNQNIENIKSIIPYQQCIILHPQLNPQPMHETFNQMRRSFLNYDVQQTRIISVNWAQNTILPEEGDRSEIKIEESFSAFFCSGKWEEVNRDDVSHMIKNKAKGIDFAMRNHILTWHMPEGEHCISYTIDSFGCKMLSSVTSRHKEPLGDTYFEYNCVDEMWKEESSCEACRIDWKWLNNNFEFQKCSSDKCLISLIHRFFSILLREYKYEPIEYGGVKYIFDQGAETEEDITVLRERCSYVDKSLKNGNVPKKFAALRDGNYRWVLNNAGNLCEKSATEQTTIYSVLFVESSQDILIEKRINYMKKLLGAGVCDRLIIYYMTMEGIKYYEKHYNTEISNPNNYNVLSEIV